MTESVSVNFSVSDGQRENFLDGLNKVTDGLVSCQGYRADDFVHRRAALQKFADQMELVLRQHDHKSTWRDKPVEALLQLLILEIEELKVAMRYFTAAEARHETVDVANFAMILYDRLGMLDPDKNVEEQCHAKSAVSPLVK